MITLTKSLNRKNKMIIRQILIVSLQLKILVLIFDDERYIVKFFDVFLTMREGVKCGR